MKKQIPILFTPSMVKAIINLLKTITRRLKDLEKINESPDNWQFVEVFKSVGKFEREQYVFRFINKSEGTFLDVPCPYGKPGDMLWVRENWQLGGWDFEDSETRIKYTDGSSILYSWDYDEEKDWQKQQEWLIQQTDRLLKEEVLIPNEKTECYDWTDKKRSWRPSIHLPKWYSRIWLEVTDIRVERLHDISEEDAINEGVVASCEISCPSAACYSNIAAFEFLWHKINGAESWKSNPWIWVVSFKVLSTTGKPEEIVEMENVGI